MPESPYLWPESRQIMGQASYAHMPPISTLVEKTDTLAGLVLDLKDSGIDWVEQHFLRRPNIRCTLVFVVYAACPTRERHLSRLLDLKQAAAKTESTIEFRLLPVNFDIHPDYRQSVLPPNTLHFYVTETQESTFCIGSTGNFGADGWPTASLNFVFNPNTIMLDSWRKWFDFIWCVAAPLTANTVKIPDLVPAKGEVDAAVMWSEFVTACSLEKGQKDPKLTATVEIDPETGEVKATAKDGTMVLMPTELNETPKLDPLTEKIARLYSQGSLVTIDKTTRTKPLDAPVRPEWFGVKSFRQVGAVSRTIQSRFTVIDEGRLKKLEEIRKCTGDILKYLSYPLSDGNRWIPEKAKPLLHSEMERMNAEGLKMLNLTVGNSVAAFVRGRMPELIKNATDLYHEFNPGGHLSKDVEDAIFKDFCTRLDRAKAGSFLPQVSFNEITFPRLIESKTVSVWGQAYTLLEAIATLPRQAVSDPFFSRGTKIPLPDLLPAMDVAEDIAVQIILKQKFHPTAKEELDLLKQIGLSELDPRMKCELVMDLMHTSELQKVIEQFDKKTAYKAKQTADDKQRDVSGKNE